MHRMNYFLISALLIGLTYACTKGTFNGQCYYCCGSFSYNNNVCTCNGQPCQTCFKQPINKTIDAIQELDLISIIRSKQSVNPESGSPYFFASNTSMDQCPRQCSNVPITGCLAGVPCNSKIYKNTNGGYPYVSCDYKYHLLKPSTYTLVYCDYSDCSGNPYSVNYQEGCNEPNLLNLLGSYCTGTLGWASGLKC